MNKKSCLNVVNRIEKLLPIGVINMIALLILFAFFESVYPLNFIFLGSMLFLVTVDTIACVYIMVLSVFYFFKNCYKPFNNYLEYKHENV